jgi:hypothetical protein
MAKSFAQWVQIKEGPLDDPEHALFGDFGHIPWLRNDINYYANQRQKTSNGQVAQANPKVDPYGTTALPAAKVDPYGTTTALPAANTKQVKPKSDPNADTTIYRGDDTDAMGGIGGISANYLKKIDQLEKRLSSLETAIKMNGNRH